MSNRIRIYMTGVGGQGTLTATTLLARVAVAQGVEVVAGEIHGMAQRGGVVESTILLGGWKSPKLGFGEADIVLGFEPLETLRGLRYLKQGGKSLRGWTPWNRPCVIALPPRGSSPAAAWASNSVPPSAATTSCSARCALPASCPSGSKRWRKAFVRSCPPSWLT